MVIFHKRSYESLFCFLSDRAYLVLKSPPQFFVRCWHVWGHISSRCVNSFLCWSNDSSDKFFDSLLRTKVPSHIFRFQSLSETKLIKSYRLPSWFKKHASWFRKRVSWYMTWNTWELKLNSTILTHSKSKLMLILSILIVNWWIWIRDGPLENLWGEGGGRSTKKKFAQGKIKWKKTLARQLTLRNIHARAWKKIIQGIR